MHISVLVRVHNQEKYLEPIMHGYNQQTFPKDMFEVVFVDDGSTDNSIKIIEEKKYSFNKKIVRLKHSGRAIALENGIMNCNGDIIIFADGDCIPKEDFIKQHAKYYINDKNVAVNGNTHIIRNLIFSKEEYLKIKDYVSFYKDISSEEKSFIENGAWPYSAIPEGINQLDYDVVNLLVDTRKNQRFKDIIDNFGEALKDCSVPWAVCHTANYSTTKELAMKILPIPEKFNSSFEDWYLSRALYREGAKFINSVDAVNFHQNHPRNKESQKERNTVGAHALMNEFPEFGTLCIEGYYNKEYSFMEFSQYVKKYNDLKETKEYGDLINLIEKMLKEYGKIIGNIKTLDN